MNFSSLSGIVTPKDLKRSMFIPLIQVYLVKITHCGKFQIERTNGSEKTFLLGRGLGLTLIPQILKLIIFQHFVCQFVAREILHRMVYDS